MTDTRTVVKLVRYTPTEIAAVATHARACGLPVARYIRETSLGAIPRIRRTHGHAELIRQLAAIGNNLNQLTHVAHATHAFPEVAVLQDAVQQVLHTIHHLDSPNHR